MTIEPLADLIRTNTNGGEEAATVIETIKHRLRRAHEENPDRAVGDALVILVKSVMTMINDPVVYAVAQKECVTMAMAAALVMELYAEWFPGVGEVLGVDEYVKEQQQP